LGGTGFIGAETDPRAAGRGVRVSVLARSIRNLPEAFGRDDVELHRGDIRDADRPCATPSATRRSS
jgi:uncharacterized protein YbjT (DUF2867 family)